MSAGDLFFVIIFGLAGLALVGFVIDVMMESARDALWPRGTRWFVPAWEGSRNGLHRVVLRIFWPEKTFKSRRLLELENWDEQWRMWAGSSDSGLPVWKPWPSGHGGRWTPRENPKPMCPCGFGNDCAIWCGSGHESGQCPEFHGVRESTYAGITTAEAMDSIKRSLGMKDSPVGRLPPPCLHKDHDEDEEVEITRLCDPKKIWLQPCGGIRVRSTGCGVRYER